MEKYTHILILCIAGWVAQFDTAGAASQESSGTNLFYQGIATCLGRYSAQVEHANSLGTPADDFRSQRETFAELYSSMAAGRDLMMLRIRAKHQHARLLWDAERRDTPRRARLAAAQLHSQLLTCDGLTLS